MTAAAPQAAPDSRQCLPESAGPRERRRQGFRDHHHVDAPQELLDLRTGTVHVHQASGRRLPGRARRVLRLCRVAPIDQEHAGVREHVVRQLARTQIQRRIAVFEHGPVARRLVDNDHGAPRADAARVTTQSVHAVAR